MEKEFEDTKFRRGCDSERFDQFWNDNTLFDCRYSRSKWLDFFQPFSFAHDVPLEVYSHALKRNKNIIHISFTQLQSNIDIKRFMCDYPWVTSISPPRRMRPIRRDLFIESNDLNTFAKEITLDPSTYIFSDARNSALSSGKLGRDAKFLISFVAPISYKSLTLRVKHSGEEYALLEVTLGSTKIQLNPPSKPSLTIDDITLYPIEVSDPSESDRLSFEPEIRNNIVIRFIGPGTGKFHRHFLHDIELLDEDGLEYMPHSSSLSKLSN